LLFGQDGGLLSLLICHRGGCAAKVLHLDVAVLRRVKQPEISGLAGQALWHGRGVAVGGSAERVIPEKSRTSCRGVCRLILGAAKSLRFGRVCGLFLILTGNLLNLRLRLAEGWMWAARVVITVVWGLAVWEFLLSVDDHA